MAYADWPMLLGAKQILVPGKTSIIGMNGWLPGAKECPMQLVWTMTGGKDLTLDSLVSLSFFLRILAPAPDKNSDKFSS